MITVKQRIQQTPRLFYTSSGIMCIICATTDREVRASDHVAALIEEVNIIRELTLISILHYDIKYSSKHIQIHI